MQLHYDISGIVTIINKACPSRSFYVWAKQTIKEDIVHGIRDDDVQWNCNNLANAELKAIYILSDPGILVRSLCPDVCPSVRHKLLDVCET